MVRYSHQEGVDSMTEDYVVDNYPIIDSEECRKIAELHNTFLKGEDPFFVETNKVKKIIIEHQENIDNEIAEIEANPPEPRFSKNIEELYHLTEMIQADISNVVRPKFTGKIKHDRFIEETNKKFIDNGIDLYTSQLVVFIESLIIEDGFSPESFRGYGHLAILMRESDGLAKMNHLLALMNKARKIIPPNISVRQIEIVEPALSKSANPRDA